jgi:hypothetical protein
MAPVFAAFALVPMAVELVPLADAASPMAMAFVPLAIALFGSSKLPPYAASWPAAQMPA